MVGFPAELEEPPAELKQSAAPDVPMDEPVGDGPTIRTTSVLIQHDTTISLYPYTCTYIYIFIFIYSFIYLSIYSRICLFICLFICLLFGYSANKCKYHRHYYTSYAFWQDLNLSTANMTHIFGLQVLNADTAFCP